MNLQEFKKLLKNPEGCELEFKEAKSAFSQVIDLPDYCAALANEGGGKLILGVTDKKPVGNSQTSFKLTKIVSSLIRFLVPSGL